MPPKGRCKWCGKLFYKRKFQIHLKYFCGSDAVGTMKQSKQSKKKGAKSSLPKEDLDEEEDDIKKIPSNENKKGEKKKKEKFKNVVPLESPTCSYESVMKSILHSVKWHSLILEEAHYIKDSRSNTTRAVFALESSYKWALRGTPILLFKHSFTDM